MRSIIARHALAIPDMFIPMPVVPIVHMNSHGNADVRAIRTSAMTVSFAQTGQGSTGVRCTAIDYLLGLGFSTTTPEQHLPQQAPHAHDMFEPPNVAFPDAATRHKEGDRLSIKDKTFVVRHVSLPRAG